MPADLMKIKNPNPKKEFGLAAIQKEQPPAVVRGCLSFLFKRGGYAVSPITL